MKLIKEKRIKNRKSFWNGFSALSQEFEDFSLLQSNGFEHDAYHKYESLLAIGSMDRFRIEDRDKNAFEKLKSFYSKHNDWIFGHLNYDLKNGLEALESQNFNGVQFPMMDFFVPQYLILQQNHTLQLWAHNDDVPSNIIDLFEGENFPESNPQDSDHIELKARWSPEDYIRGFNAIMKHIHSGDIYEMNYCQEFYSEGKAIKPDAVFKKLSEVSPAPFGAFYRRGHKYLMSSSPERYLCKRGDKIISMPIKGTAPRGKNPKEDLLAKINLQQNKKERAENIMIVDLVRNDLSRTAQKASVNVEELCEIYSFPQVHQMISTVVSKLHPSKSLFDAIKYSFPMGSMTGAPKISAMKIIEEQEAVSRDLFSGSVGYIDPNGDFDFNVVIRSILYNALTKYVSIMAGGAITHQAHAEAEYQESLLKAKALMEVLSAKG